MIFFYQRGDGTVAKHIIDFAVFRTWWLSGDFWKFHPSYKNSTWPHVSHTAASFAKKAWSAHSYHGVQDAFTANFESEYSGSRISRRKGGHGRRIYKNRKSNHGKWTARAMISKNGALYFNVFNNRNVKLDRLNDWRFQSASTVTKWKIRIIQKDRIQRLTTKN